MLSVLPSCLLSETAVAYPKFLPKTRYSLKQPQTLQMYHIRKRALLACDFCRHRKRRCDGAKPCSNCVSSAADCVYQELPFERVEVEPGPSSAVLDRLSRIETLLEQQSHQLHQLDARSSQSPYPASLSEQNEFTRFKAADHSSSLEPSQFLIPKNHAAQISSLLSLPQVREVIGDIPRDYFNRVENSLPLPPALENFHDGRLVLPVLDPQTLETLVGRYFQFAHPHHPLFTPATLGAWQRELLQSQDHGSIRTAICLCVYALGSLCNEQDEDSKSVETLGLEYFQPALKIIMKEMTWSFSPRIEVCQALLLAASYFAHLGRPLHTFRMGYNASHMFLFLAESRQYHISHDEFNNEEMRVFWQCFMVECDGITILNHSRTGIEPLADKMPLPQSLEAADNENHIYSIAEHAIRRLTNRIQNTLYDPDDTHQYSTLPPDPVYVWQRWGLQRLLSLSVELNRQLEEWHRSIPEYLRFPKGTTPLPNDRSRILRTRYYIAQHLIYRPFLLQTISKQPEYWSSAQSMAMDPDPINLTMPIILERSETCINACMNLFQNTIEMMDKRSPYLWQLSISCFSSLILLWLASNSTTLAHLVPPMRPMQSMVLEKLGRWAVKGSSFESQVQILEQLVFPDHN
ncbi:hypothetical protein F5Y16DRAFT_371500 [Xylariaceae sp. FL0255]|nr:hypothetical protein F5Y16DRAFT_371500 [Xylariaceae sp. FL0255]